MKSNDTECDNVACRRAIQALRPAGNRPTGVTPVCDDRLMSSQSEHACVARVCIPV